jgi:hypothetical protein
MHLRDSDTSRMIAALCEVAETRYLSYESQGWEVVIFYEAVDDSFIC